MSRVAIVGAGNLGGFLAAHLCGAGHEVFLCVRHPPPEIQVEGFPDFQVPFFVEDPPPADIVLLTVKAHDTPSAMNWLERLCVASQPIAVIQNGVNHAARVHPFKAIPVLSYVYIEAHNGVRRAFTPPRAHFVVPDGSASSPFVNLFAGTSIQVHQEPAFQTAAWRKMLHNCVSNPLTAIAGRGLEILQEPLYRDWAERILAETIPIARAEGADLLPNEAKNILDVLASYPRGTRTSMLQDLEAGKRLELEALNGALVELGRRHSVPTPVNEDLIQQLSAKR